MTDPSANRAERRRPATRAEQLTPCEICSFPLTERHHMLAIKHYGETEIAAQLCANCHRVYHLIESAYQNVTESQAKLRPFMDDPDLRSRILAPLLRKFDQANELHQAIQLVTEVIVRDGSEIKRRIANGESQDCISREYWRKAGIDWF